MIVGPIRTKITYPRHMAADGSGLLIMNQFVVLGSEKTTVVQSYRLLIN